MKNSLVCGVGSFVPYKEFTRYKSGSYTFSREYHLWFNMINRCYSEKYQLRNPSYIGCKVDPDWYSTDNFWMWCETQIGFNLTGYQLDKDLLGDRLYSEDTCCFISEQLNYLLANHKSKDNNLPTGVCFDTSRGKYIASIKLSGKYKNLGRYDTPEKAYGAYLEKRSEVIKGWIDILKSGEYKVEDKVIEALENYKTEN